MSRQLKFRAWFDGHMYEVAKLDFWGDPDQATCDLARPGEDGNVEEIFEVYLHEVELMQYTGLKDKNGKEIYEGDIVKCTDGADEISELNSDTGIGKIEWLEEWGFWNISNIENGLGDISYNGYVEVIGNIYENPELIPEVPHA